MITYTDKISKSKYSRQSVRGQYILHIRTVFLFPSKKLYLHRRSWELFFKRSHNERNRNLKRYKAKVQSGEENKYNARSL